MLETILLNNPEIDNVIYQAYSTDPKYQALEANYQAKWKALKKAFIEWEEAYSTEMSFIAQTHFRIGLGLRRELVSTLNITDRRAP